MASVIYYLIEMKNTATLYVSGGTVSTHIMITNDVNDAAKFKMKTDAQKAIDRSPEQIRPYLVVEEHIFG